MRAVVTGGAGFIGSNLVDALLERGDEVQVADDLSTGRPENLEAALARGALLHQADVRRSIADPAHDTSVNVTGTVNVLEAARRAGVRRVVNSSTGGAIYGETD